MTVMRKKWYERIEHARISEDWVRLHCKNVTDREKKLLEIIYERKLVRRDHLEILHPGYRDIPRRTNVINRSIKKLYELMCLDKVHEQSEYMKGNLPAVLAIDKAGALLIGKPFKRRIKQVKKTVGQEQIVIRELPSNYPHIHGINKLEVIITEWALKHGFRFRWFLENENEKQFIFNGERVILIPDVFTIINAKGKIALFYIEYDTGKEDNRNKTTFPTIYEKLQKYYWYKLTGIWKKEWWAVKIKTDFPMILFVTEDKGRIEYVKEKAKNFGLNLDAILESEFEFKLDRLFK